MARVFKTKAFQRQMKKSGLGDKSLCLAVQEMRQGLIDADLGGGVVKKRVALPGRGKSGGARTLLATNYADRWFFVFGFQKNERDNVSTLELLYVKQVANVLLSRSSEHLQHLLAAGELMEICNDES